MAVTLKGNNGTYEGTSEDNKPLDVPVNTEFDELDTGKTYYFDGETWNEEPPCEGSGFTPTAEQLAAMNSGINAEDVEQITTNKNNILSKANTSDVNSATANLQNQIDQIVISASAESVVAPEVAAARVGANGTEYNTLKARLDTENGILNTELDHIEKGEYLEQNLQFAVSKWNIVPLDISKYTQFELLSDIARDVYTLSSTTSASSEYRLDHITLAANRKEIFSCTKDAVAIGFYGDGNVDMKYSTRLIATVEKLDNDINFDTKGISGESDLAPDIGYVYPVKALTLSPNEKYSLYVVTEDLTGQSNVALRRNGTTIKTFPVTLSSTLTEYNTTFTVDDELENVNIGHYCGSGVSGKVTTTIIKKSNNSTIPYYYKDHIESKIAEIRQNMQNVGRNGETFVFITDVHWEANTQNSPSLISELLNKLNINLILCGGDLINQSEDKALMAKTMNECVRAFNFKNTFFPVAFGNHDNNSNGISVENQFSSNDVYALMQKQAENHVTYITTDKFNFYFDVSATKTRFIVCDTGTNGDFNKYDELTALLNTTPNGYKVIIVAHWLMQNNVKSTFANNLGIIIDAFNSRETCTIDGTSRDFTNANGEIVCTIAGHAHYDDSWSTTDGIPFIITDCDCGTRTNNTDYPYASGTITEQAFDVVTIDYVNRTIKCTRIGRGSDRIIEY